MGLEQLRRVSGRCGLLWNRRERRLMTAGHARDRGDREACRLAVKIAGWGLLMQSGRMLEHLRQ